MADPVDDERLSEVLKILSNPVRLRLLRYLQRPTPLSEIRVSPARKDGEDRPDRPVSRVTVRQHLEQLLAIGAIEKTSSMGPGRSVDLYTVVPSQLFVLAEEIMEVARVQRRVEANEVTRMLDATHRPAAGEAGLVLVNGVYEGEGWPLKTTRRDGDGWTIGRAAACSVPLAFDPYVSTVHATIVEHDGFVVRAEPGARNPLLVDWQRVEAGAAVPLTSGTVLTVGRSTLVFRA